MANFHMMISLVLASPPVHPTLFRAWHLHQPFGGL